jgi:hypothetical protein
MVQYLHQLDPEVPIEKTMKQGKAYEEINYQ